MISDIVAVSESMPNVVRVVGGLSATMQLDHSLLDGEICKLPCLSGHYRDNARQNNQYLSVSFI